MDVCSQYIVTVYLILNVYIDIPLFPINIINTMNVYVIQI